MSKVLHIGKLDRKVSIYERQTVKSSTGENTVTDVLFKEAWAMADDVTSREEEDGKIYLLAIRSYTIRYDQVIAERGQKMNIDDYDGRYYITGIEHIGRKAFLRLKAIRRE